MNKKTALLIFIFSILIYCNSLGGSFIWDDQAFVVHNPAIRSLANFRYFFTNPMTIAVGELNKDVYRPITTLSYSLDFFLWRLNSFGYHLTNVIFHSLNGALLFLLLLLVFDNLFFAVAGSLIFVSHPVQTEVVAWISGRSSVLFMFFYLLAFIFYVKWRRRHRNSYYIYSVVFFIFSIFSKEMAITLPVALILYDLHFAKIRDIGRKIPAYLPYFITAAFFLLLRVNLVGRVGQFGGWGAPYHVFLTMSRVVTDYIRILFFPARLCAIGYDISMSRSIFNPRTLFSILFLAAILSGLPYLHKRFRIISFSVLFFVVSLVPVLNIIPIKALEADRFLYLPSIGFCIFAAFILSKIDRKFKHPVIRNGPKASIIMLFALIALYSLRTVTRNADWNDEITIGKKTLEVSSKSGWALTTLGQNYLEGDNYEEAIKYLEKAVKQAPGYDLAHNLLGTAYFKTGHYAAAASEFIKSLRLNYEASPPVHDMLGISYASLKMYNKARKEFETAQRIDPDFINPYLNMGRLYEINNNYPAALKQYFRAVVHAKNNAYLLSVTYIRIGDAYARMGLADKAKRYYINARNSLRPDMEGLLKLVSEKINSLPK